MSGKTVADVKGFWESAPLFTGESSHPVGSREFFEEHRSVYVRDCFAGRINPRVFPEPANADRVLDLGCGPGFWVVELARAGCTKVTASDLTDAAVALARERARLFAVQADVRRENAEALSFPDGAFSHVNCLGVIHHTPDTAACVREIARVLRPGGTATISVYYRNIYLRLWPALRYAGRALGALGAGLSGRGREGIYATADADEIVRLYDGKDNPIGKAYSRKQFIALLAPHLEVESVFYHFFPARSLPFRIPGWLHRMLDRRTGFMIVARCRKPVQEARAAA